MCDPIQNYALIALLVIFAAPNITNSANLLCIGVKDTYSEFSWRLGNSVDKGKRVR